MSWNWDQYRVILMIIGCTLVSGWGDAQGFIHAAGIWDGGRPVLSRLAQSGLWFGLGIGSYWLALRYLQEFGVVTPEFQTMIWFGVTLVGVALLSGKFIQWQTTDQIVAAGVLSGIAWLLLRTSS